MARIWVIGPQSGPAAAAADALVRVGFTVERSHSLVEFETGLGRRRADVIVLDLASAGGSGYRLYSRLRRSANLAEVPVLALGNEDEAQSLVLDKRIGAQDLLLHKPIDVAALVSHVRALVLPDDLRTSPWWTLCQAIRVGAGVHRASPTSLLSLDAGVDRNGIEGVTERPRTSALAIGPAVLAFPGDAADIPEPPVIRTDLPAHSCEDDFAVMEQGEPRSAMSSPQERERPPPSDVAETHSYSQARIALSEVARSSAEAEPVAGAGGTRPAVAGDPESQSQVAALARMASNWLIDYIDHAPDKECAEVVTADPTPEDPGSPLPLPPVEDDDKDLEFQRPLSSLPPRPGEAKPLAQQRGLDSPSLDGLVRGRSLRLSSAQLPLLLWRLRRERFSGAIALGTDGGRLQLFYEAGHPIGVHTPTGFAASLEKRGLLEMRDLERLRRRGLSRVSQVGVYLMRHTELRPQHVLHLARAHLEEALVGLLGARPQTLTLTHDTLAPVDRVSPIHSLPTILAEGFHRHWSSPRLERFLGGRDCMLGPASADRAGLAGQARRLGFSRGAVALLAMLDGGCTAEGLCQRSGKPLRRVLGQLAAARICGLLVPTSPSLSRPAGSRCPAAPSASRVDAASAAVGKLSIAVVRALIASVDQKDAYTAGHSNRVGIYACLLGREIGIEGRALDNLGWAALLHDVGKIGIRDAVLGKQGKLDHEEMQHMRSHPRRGVEVLRALPQLQAALPGVLHHHERPDGRGYPDGLSGTEIPLMARIIQIADVFDALTTARPYRDAMPCERTLGIMRADAGGGLDAELFEVFAARVRAELKRAPRLIELVHRAAGRELAIAPAQLPDTDMITRLALPTAGLRDQAGQATSA